MQGLDLRKFKKVSSDAHSTQLQHPDGHTISIAHNRLKGDLKKQLEALPAYSKGGDVGTTEEMTSRPDKGWGAIIVKDKPEMQQYADGGQVDAEDYFKDAPQDNVVQDASSTLQAPATAPAFASINSDQGQPGGEVSLTDKVSPSVPANIAVPTAPSLPTQPAGTDMMGALNNMTGGIQGQANAEGDLGKQHAALAEQQQANIQKTHNEFIQDSHAVLQDFNHLVDDAKNDRIDPNRFWNNKSDLGKVSSAIGLILGGMGRGLTGKDNPAMQFMNSQIDRDVDAQKSNMANRNNIMHALQQQYGNIKDASNMTRAFYAEMYSSKLEEAAAKTSDPMAKARAQQAIGQIQMQYGPIVQETMLRQALMQGAAKGNIAPEKLVSHLVPKEHQEAVYKELERAQNATQNEQNVLQQFDKASKENTLVRRTGHLGAEPASLANARNLLMPILKDNEGRINETEIKMMEDFLPKAGDLDSKIAQKRVGLQQFIEAKKAAPRAANFGIQVPRATSFKPRQ